MPKYRKKPVVIEAEQWNEMGNVSKCFFDVVVNMHKVIHSGLIVPEPDYIVEFNGKSKMSSKTVCRSIPIKAIKTLEGWHEVSFGDWIIKGISGELYPCKPDIFDATYERVNTVEVIEGK